MAIQLPNLQPPPWLNPDSHNAPPQSETNGNGIIPPDSPDPAFEILLQRVLTFVPLRFNEITLRLEWQETPGAPWKFLSERNQKEILLQMKRKGVGVPKGTFYDIIESSLVPGYNPVDEYRKALPKWDGLPHIYNRFDMLQPNRNRAKKDEWMLMRSVYRKWVLSAAAGFLGWKTNDMCLVLVGPQRIGKTTWLNAHCPPTLFKYLMCGKLDLTMGDKQTLVWLAEKLFVNIDDQLESIFGRDHNAIKGIISAPFVTVRKAYAQDDEQRARLCSFMASVNSHNFLTDTVNRRYLCLDVEQIAHPSKAGPIDQFWAEAFYLLDKGEKHAYTADDFEAVEQVSRHFTEITSEAELLVKYFRPPAKQGAGDHMTTTDILKELQSTFPGDRLNSTRLNRALKRYGFPYVQQWMKEINQPRYGWMVERGGLTNMNNNPYYWDDEEPPKNNN